METMPDPLGPTSQRRFYRLSGYQVFNSINILALRHELFT